MNSNAMRGCGLLILGGLENYLRGRGFGLIVDDVVHGAVDDDSVAAVGAAVLDVRAVDEGFLLHGGDLTVLPQMMQGRSMSSES